jgi:predicted S18 family serine protease
MSSSPYERQQLITFLGVAMNRSVGDEPKGAVGQLIIEWMPRADHEGMTVTCSPGFSPYTMTSMVAAIERAARFAGLDSNAWNVVIRRYDNGPRYGMVYGDSLSAMVGLTVIALAKGDRVLPDHVLTGTITADGQLGPVSAVDSKIEAAHAMHFRRVIVPDSMDPSDKDWHTPFLMQVSPIQWVAAAYHALTGRQMVSRLTSEQYATKELSAR